MYFYISVLTCWEYMVFSKTHFYANIILFLSRQWLKNYSSSSFQLHAFAKSCGQNVDNEVKVKFDYFIFLWTCCNRILAHSISNNWNEQCRLCISEDYMCICNQFVMSDFHKSSQLRFSLNPFTVNCGNLVGFNFAIPAKIHNTKIQLSQIFSLKNITVWFDEWSQI